MGVQATKRRQGGPPVRVTRRGQRRGGGGEVPGASAGPCACGRPESPLGPRTAPLAPYSVAQHVMHRGHRYQFMERQVDPGEHVPVPRQDLRNKTQSAGAPNRPLQLATSSARCLHRAHAVHMHT